MKMIFSLKQEAFFKWFFTEPSTEKYAVSKDLSIDVELEWKSSKNDAINLANDYKKVKEDLNKAFEEYKLEHNG